MRFAIIYRPKTPPPAGDVPGLIKEMAEWMQNHGGRLDGVQFFVGGGGFGTIETDDAAELSRLISEHPFTPYAEVEVKPVIDPATAISVMQEVYS
jgi:hypothetical protein